MSQTVEAPETVTPINHWIGGKPWSGGSGRSGPGPSDPASGRQTGEVAFASVEEVDRAVAAAREAAGAWREVSLSQRADIFFRIRSPVRRAPARHRRAPHGRARQGHLRRARRGGPWPRGDRDTAAACPSFRRAASASRCRAASTCTRSASRSAWWPASRRSTSRRWSRCGCGRRRSPAATRSALKPSEKDPFGVDPHRGAAQAGGRARRRLQRDPRRSRGGGCAARASLT